MGEAEVPEGWTRKAIGDVLSQTIAPVEIANDRVYELISIRRRHGGMFLREERQGSEILDKRMQAVGVGAFTIARRQIVHGACAIAPERFSSAVMSMSYSAFAGTPHMLADFFFLLAQQPEQRKQFWDASHGVVDEKLNFQQDDWLRMTVPVPPLDEQRRISEILGAIDGAILATERLIAKQTSVRAGLLDEALESARSSGEDAPLDDLGSWISGGTPSTARPDYWGGSVPWITASSLKSKYLRSSDRTLTPAGVSAGSRTVERGSLLMVVRGMSLNSEFRVGIAARDLAFGQDCKAFIPPRGIAPEFLHLMLEAQANGILRRVDRASHGTAKLDMGQLGAVRIPLVAASAQSMIVDPIRAIDARIINDTLELDKLRMTRAGLADDLLSGRVRTVSR